MAVITLLDLQFKPDLVDEALELFSRVLVDTRAFDGCRKVTVIRDHEDPAHVVAVEEWESLEHDAAYRRWRAGDGTITELPPLLAGAPRTTVGVPIDGV
jgi:quinol monooxygenase YgiN